MFCVERTKNATMNESSIPETEQPSSSRESRIPETAEFSQPTKHAEQAVFQPAPGFKQRKSDFQHNNGLKYLPVRARYPPITGDILPVNMSSSTTTAM